MCSVPDSEGVIKRIVCTDVDSSVNTLCPMLEKFGDRYTGPFCMEDAVSSSRPELLVGSIVVGETQFGFGSEDCMKRYRLYGK